MKIRWSTTVFLMLVICQLSTNTKGAAQYKVVHGWPILPEGRIIGEATGVGVDSQNHVFVFHRAREWTDPLPEEPIKVATIIVFDGNTGEMITEWGQNLFIMPHGLTIDDQDNVWLTDVGRHQVFKFTNEGDHLLTVGTNGVSGDGSSHFSLPTDVAVLPDGRFYVSDGYGNSRIVRFSAYGKYEFEWGTRGSEPGQFDLPHGIAINAEGHIYVAGRSNQRIQIFDTSGTFITQWKSEALGRPYSVAIGKDGKAYVVDGGDQPRHPPDRSRAFRLTLDGTIETTFGRFGNYDGQFRLGHDIAIGKDGAVYIVDAWGMRVQKFVQR